MTHGKNKLKDEYEAGELKTKVKDEMRDKERKVKNER
jgi:hypothetical protein